MKQMSKKIPLLLCILLIISNVFCSCSKPDPYKIDTTFYYNDALIMGKNSNDIQAMYGEFDKVKPQAYITNLSECKNNEGLYVNCIAGYFTGAGHDDFSIVSLLLFPVYDEYYLIYFDGDGIAYKIEKHRTFNHKDVL